jgi:hypothetical protein
MADDHGKYDPLGDLGPLLGAVLNYDMTSASHYAGRLGLRLGITGDDSAETVTGKLREALGVVPAEERYGVPVGTVEDRTSRAPRTVWRDATTLLIPPVRLNAAGCELLRKILVNEAVNLAIVNDAIDRAMAEDDEAERLAHAARREGK